MQPFIKRIPLLLLALTVNHFGNAQEMPDIRDISKVTIFNPGLSYEKRIGKFQSLYGQAFMNTSITLGYSDALGNMSSIYFDPALALQYRYYYNYGKRDARGKPTKMNNLNYVALIEETTFSRAAISSSYVNELDRRAINRIGVAWGLQRNFPKRFSVDLYIGPGYLWARSTSVDYNGYYISTRGEQFTIVGQLNIGIWLNKRN
jgi:hypothetical protein